VSSDHYVQLTLTSFFRKLTEEVMYWYFMQDRAKVHIAYFSVTV